MTESDFTRMCSTIKAFGDQRARSLNDSLSFLTGSERKRLFTYLTSPKFGWAENKSKSVTETKDHLNTDLSNACLGLMKAAAEGLKCSEEIAIKAVETKPTEIKPTEITIKGNDKFSVIIDLSKKEAYVNYLGGSTAQAPEPGTPPGAEGPLGRFTTVLAGQLVSYVTR